MMQRPFGVAVILSVSLGTSLLQAGEIAGMPSQAPPFLIRDFEISLSNDFLGRGGSIDDFRTQQIIVSAKLGDDWLALVDHSILTLSDSDQAGRIDQLSVSLGYQLLGNQGVDHASSITIGGGIRGTGNFAGGRMQNGFHRLIGSDVETMPYVDTRGTDITMWLDAQWHRLLHESAGGGFFGGWRSGYWLRGGALVTSDSQTDGMLGAYAVASRNSIDLWFGLRRDWRQGYDSDFVQQATAAAESDLGVVLGARFGALLIETVQQPGGDASFGQLKFVSTGRNSFPNETGWPRGAIEFGFLLPDVHVQIAGRYRSNILLDTDTPWRQSLLLETRFGEPQFDDDTSVFISTQQVSAGVEMECQLSPELAWMSFYGSLALGYRGEQLVGDNVLTGQDSARVGRAVLGAAAGLRFNAASLGNAWGYRLQLGIAAWHPMTDAEVQMAGNSIGFRNPRWEFYSV